MPVEKFRELGARVEKIVVPEMNCGQLRGEVERYMRKEAIGVNRADGEVYRTEHILEVL
jgi:2-oxoglutarate ferredoxin oxidoreductase subunit alpha